MSEGKKEKGKIDTVGFRIQELSEQRVQLMLEVDKLSSRDPDGYVSALIHMQRCERELGLLLKHRGEAQDMKLFKLQVNDNDVSGGGMSITIFFLPGVDFGEVHKKIKKIVTWKWLRGCIYAYEQKGEDELTLGHNAHVHIFVPTQYGKQRAIKELSNSLKGLIYSPASVHVLWKPTTWLGSCQSYLTGQKSGAVESVYEYDRLWRDRNELPHPDVTAAESLCSLD